MVAACSILRMHLTLADSTTAPKGHHPVLYLFSIYSCEPRHATETKLQLRILPRISVYRMKSFQFDGTIQYPKFNMGFFNKIVVSQARSSHSAAFSSIRSCSGSIVFCVCHTVIQSDSHMSMYAAGACFRLDDAHLGIETCSQPTSENNCSCTCLPPCLVVGGTTSKLPPSMHAVCHFNW